MRKVVDNFSPSGGKHCVTHALKQIFEFKGYPLSEAMLFGLGGGLSFIYLNMSDAPMICGRSKIFEFEKKLGHTLGASIRCSQSASYDNALKKTKQMLDNYQPVLVYVDMPYLKYLGMDEGSHFGGHAIVIFGYDDEKQCFYVSDRDHSDYPIRSPKGIIAKDYHLVPYAQMKQARSSTHRPFPARNKYLQIDLSNRYDLSSDMILSSIQGVCEGMLQKEAKLLGLNGIQKFSKEVLKWAKFDDVKLQRTAINNYFLINKDGGTGGGIFRRMYGDFLIECATLTQRSALESHGHEYHAIATQWDAVADLLWELYETGNRSLLEKISDMAQSLYKKEDTLVHALLKSVL